MGEADFIRELEKLFEDNPMRRESVERILQYQIRSVNFYTSRDPTDYAGMIRIPRRYVDSVDVYLNILHTPSEIEVSFAHEIAHAYYDNGVSRVFNKYQDECLNWTAHISGMCEEDLVEWSAERFCMENPDYMRNVLIGIILGTVHNHIETSYESRALKLPDYLRLYFLYAR